MPSGIPMPSGVLLSLQNHCMFACYKATATFDIGTGEIFLILSNHTSTPHRRSRSHMPKRLRVSTASVRPALLITPYLCVFTTAWQGTAAGSDTAHQEVLQHKVRIIAKVLP